MCFVSNQEPYGATLNMKDDFSVRIACVRQKEENKHLFSCLYDWFASKRETLDGDKTSGETYGLRYTFF